MFDEFEGDGVHWPGQSCGKKRSLLLVSVPGLPAPIRVPMLLSLHQQAIGQIVAIDGIPVLALHQVLGTRSVPMTDHSASGPPSPAT